MLLPPCLFLEIIILVLCRLTVTTRSRIMAHLVIFGLSNILSDLVDAATSIRMMVRVVVRHEQEEEDQRSVPLAARLKAWAHIGQKPVVLDLNDFVPVPEDVFLLGPTTPKRKILAALVTAQWPNKFITLVHRTAYVSPMATLSPGVFIGANSVVAAGTTLEEHVFVNRGATIGHDNIVGAFSRIQPGAALGGLSQIGKGVTIGIGARTVERLHIGDDAVVAAGSVVVRDVASRTLVAGSPARFSKNLY
jgi:sugar O-acyltransferase (sialic acid O-acetyltransferase NeuD family)